MSIEQKFLLLDEPFSMLDSLTRLDLQDKLLDVWEKSRKVVVMVTHDPLAAERAKITHRLDKGKLAL